MSYKMNKKITKRLIKTNETVSWRLLYWELDQFFYRYFNLHHNISITVLINIHAFSLKYVAEFIVSNK